MDITSGARHILNEMELALTKPLDVETRVSRAYLSGSGDSLAVSLVLEGMTQGRFKAFDPYDMLSWEEYDLPVIVTSVSGRTLSSLSLARRVRNKGGTVIVVTGDVNSPLAREAETVIALGNTRTLPVPGSFTFLRSLKAVASVAGVGLEGEPLSLQDVPPSPREPIVIGSGGNYGVAYFASLKYAEMFGERCLHERLEQFFHAVLFANLWRDVVILTSGDPRERVDVPFARVMHSGCHTVVCNIMWVTVSLFKRWEIEGGNSPFFMQRKNVLDFSSRNIYGDVVR